MLDKTNIISKLAKAIKTFFIVIFNFLKVLFKNLGPIISILLFISFVSVLFFIHAFFSDPNLTQKTFNTPMELPSVRGNWDKKVQIGTVSTEISKVVVGSEKAKEKFKAMISNQRNPEYEHKLDEAAEIIISRRRIEAGNLFGEIINKIDGENGFARRHYDERGNKELMVSYMNQELLSEETLLDFFNATAIEIDNALYSIVNQELDGMLKDMILKNPNMTLDELRKRMPNSRAICEEIYARLNNEMINKLQENGLLEMANDFLNKLDDRESKEIITTGKEKIHRGLKTSLIGGFIIGVGIGIGVAISGPIGLGVGLTGALVTGWGAVDTLSDGYNYTVGTVKAAGESYREKCIKVYINTFKEAVAQTGEKFKDTLALAVKDIINEYKKMDIFRNAEIIVDGTPIRQYSVELVPSH